MKDHPFEPGQNVEIRDGERWLKGRIRSRWWETVGQRGRRKKNAHDVKVFEDVAYVSAVLTGDSKKTFSKIRVERVRPIE